jgi:aspartate kinase
MVVRSSFNDSEGTYVKEDTEVENMVVTGVAVDDNVARITIVGVEDEPGAAFRIFSLLAKNRISVDIIVQAVGRNGKKDISFTVEKENLNEALRVLEENKAWVGHEAVGFDDGIAKLSVVGAGMANNPGVASEMFEALFNVDVNIGLISTSEIKISVLVDAKDAKRGAVSVHEKFFGKD